MLLYRREFAAMTGITGITIDGKKIILPIHGYCSYSWKKNELDSRYIDGIFSDLERALCFLSKGERTPRVSSLPCGFVRDLARLLAVEKMHLKT